MTQEIEFLGRSHFSSRRINNATQLAIDRLFFWRVNSDSWRMLHICLSLKSFKMRNWRIKFSCLSKLQIFGSNIRLFKFRSSFVLNRGWGSFSNFLFVVFIMKSRIVTYFSALWKLLERICSNIHFWSYFLKLFSIESFRITIWVCI